MSDRRDGGAAEIVMLDVTLEALPGRRDRMAALLRETMALSQAEAGCLIYRFGADLNDADRFGLTELWESEADLAAHMSGAAFVTFSAGLPQCGRVLESTVRIGMLRPHRLTRPAHG